MKNIVKILLIVCGSISIALGIIGIVLPLLPTTPFLLLGAACYLRGSKKLHYWLINNRLLGSYIKNYQSGKGIPAKTKIVSITLLWLSIINTIIFVIPLLLIKILLIIIALLVTCHILSLKTLKVEVNQEETSEDNYEDQEIKAERNNFIFCQLLWTKAVAYIKSLYKSRTY